MIIIIIKFDRNSHFLNISQLSQLVAAKENIPSRVVQSLCDFFGIRFLGIIIL